jgi:RimJ/RimL family protein N-acetyltransferase
MVRFQKYTEKDANDLMQFLLAEEWVFHVGSKLTEEEIQKNIQSEYHDGAGIETHWIIFDREKIGFVRIYDLDDETPLFDLRIKSEMRGKGIGNDALEFVKQHVFTDYPQVRRIEGYTRVDNLAMRRVFEKCGFVKEAQHRQSWPGSDGIYYDAVGYAVLQSDWENGSVTELNWN